MVNLWHLKKGNSIGISMIFTNFKPKKSPFWPFLVEKLPKIHQIGFGCKKSSKFEENSNIYSLVPQIYHPVSLCACMLSRIRISDKVCTRSYTPILIYDAKNHSLDLKLYANCLRHPVLLKPTGCLKQFVCHDFFIVILAMLYIIRLIDKKQS